MENRSNKKKITILVVICLIAFGFVLVYYFGFGKQKETELIDGKGDQIKIHYFNTTGAIVYIGDDGKINYSFKERKVQSIDTTIKDKVVSISCLHNCDGEFHLLIALTDKGDIYYNKNSKFSYETGKYDLSFVKIDSREKIVSLKEEVIEKEPASTCSGNHVFASTEDNKFEVSCNSSKGSCILGESYEELYSYVDTVGSYNPGYFGPVYYLFEDGTVAYNKANNFIMIDNSKLQMSKLITFNDAEQYYKADAVFSDYLVSKDNKLYQISYLGKDAKQTDYQIKLYSDSNVASILMGDNKITITFENGEVLTVDQYHLKELR